MPDAVLAGVRNKYIIIGSLDFANNEIGDFNSISIAALLQEETVLKSLNLRNNKITAKGLQTIAEALAKNTTLESLDLSLNNIGNATMTETEMMAAKMTREEANFKRNERNNAGVVALANALETNITLKSLNLEHNIIQDFGQQALKESIYVNSLFRKNCGIKPLEVIGVEPLIFDEEKEAALQKRVHQIIAAKNEADRPSAGTVIVRETAAEAALLSAGATGESASRYN